MCTAGPPFQKPVTPAWLKNGLIKSQSSFGCLPVKPGCDPEKLHWFRRNLAWYCQQAAKGGGLEHAQMS